MSLKVRIGNRYLPVISASVKDELSSVPEFEVVVPYRSIVGEDFWGEPASLVHNGETVITGIVYDGPVPDATKEVAVATISCYGELGRLMNLGAFSKAHYQHQSLIAIMTDLLNTWTDTWRLGSVSTMLDALEITTVDLRSKEARWAQVVEAAKSIPYNAVRYGGFDAQSGRYQVDMGAFGELHPEILADSDNIIEKTLKRVRSSYERLKVLEAYGGKVGDMVIHLGHAQEYDNIGIGSHAEYPVTFQGIPGDPSRNWYIVTNNNLERGVTRRRDFDIHRPEGSDAPTAAEIQECGYALWRRCIREFERSKPSETYTCTVKLAQIPLIGCKMRLIARNIETEYDAVTQEERRVPAFDVNDEYFLTSYEIRFEGDLRLFDITLTDQPYDPPVDDDLEVFEKTERVDKLKFSGSLSNFGPMIRPRSLHHFNTASDCVASGSPGKLFEIPLPAAPLEASAVNYTLTTIPASGVQVEVIQVPSMSQGLIACVRQGGVWTMTSNVILTAYYVFS